MRQFSIYFAFLLTKSLKINCSHSKKLRENVKKHCLISHCFHTRPNQNQETTFYLTYKITAKGGLDHKRHTNAQRLVSHTNQDPCNCRHPCRKPDSKQTHRGKYIISLKNISRVLTASDEHQTDLQIVGVQIQCQS